MELFDFMSDEDFRASLESDYHELELCVDAGAWKAVHVLAGSIIETILLDYLVATDYPKRSASNLSKMSLFEIIDVCKREGILTNKSADLAHVVREYRNLIHPERLRRLAETADENGAVVAQALVRMVVKEVATRRREVYGDTADQLVKKILRDPSVTSILGHLLKSTNEFEMKRLLSSVLPKQYFFLLDPTNRPDGAAPSRTILSTLEKCFRLAFEAVSDETKQEVAKKFVRILKEESADVVATYETAFFRAKDLVYYCQADVQLVKHHFLSSLKESITTSLLKAMEGIGAYLTPEEVEDFFVDPFVKNMVNDDISPEEAKEIFLAEFSKMTSDTQDKVAERLKEWVDTLNDRSEWEPDAKMIQDLRENVSHRISFREIADLD